VVSSEVSIAASSVFLGTSVGAGVNQALFLMPRWFASPPESLALARDRGPAKLFIPLQLGSAIALVTARVLNRRHAARRRLLSLALGCYVATWASTAVYFAPEIIRLTREGGEIPAPEIARRGRRWLNASWGRHLALAAAFVLSVAALEQRPARGVRRLAGAWAP
jgi:hypothetical protein